jgi:hypothetical protein
MSIPTLRSLDLPAIKSAGVQRARAYAPSGPVCVATQGFAGVAAAHGFDLTCQRKVSAHGLEVEFKASEAVGSHPTLKFEIKTKTT